MPSEFQGVAAKKREEPYMENILQELYHGNIRLSDVIESAYVFEDAFKLGAQIMLACLNESGASEWRRGLI